MRNVDSFSEYYKFVFESGVFICVRLAYDDFVTVNNTDSSDMIGKKVER